MYGPVGVVGAGNVGTALAMAWKNKGYALSGVCCRTEKSAREATTRLDVPFFLNPAEVASRSEIVLITTPDREITSVCNYIAENQGFRQGQVVLHTSGAHTCELLEPARKEGAGVLSLHPLQTFPSVDTGFNNLPGSYFTLEGEEHALKVGEELVSALEGNALTIPTEMKPIYHASACVACNYFVALLDLSLKMMEEVGVPREKALPALMPLVEGTLANVKKVGVPQGLTGPIDRGDASTVESHVLKLKEKMPSILDLYRQLGNYTAQVASEKGTLHEEEKNNIKFALGYEGNEGEKL